MGSEYSLTENQQQIKQRFREDVGYWPPSFDAVLQIDPEFFEKYRKWLSYPMEGDGLDPKTREFVLIAAYSQVTHLGTEGIERHVERAFDEGATVSEILEVLQISSVLGMHSYMRGAEILDEQMGLSETLDDEEFERLLDEWEEKRGYRPEWWRPYVAPDPGYLWEYLEYSAHPWLTGTLDPKVREFLYIANDATPAHLLQEGIDAHMENAIGLGATADELAEVFQLVTLLSFDTIVEGLPILVDVAERRGELDG